MVKTKQTAHGGKSRQEGMQVARFGGKPEKGQFVEAPDDDDKENSLDLDAPCKGKEAGEPSKSTGKEGDQPVPQAEVPPVQAEGGATATPAAGPDSAIMAPPQNSTDEPQDPQADTSAEDPGLKEYVDSYMQAAKDWFDSIQNDKVKAYMELYNTLLQIGKPLIKGLEQVDGNTVLDSIVDKSGQFISKVDKCMVYVYKEEETIMKKPVVVNRNAKKAISEYYKAAQDLCQSQAIFMQKMREMEEVINDKNIFLDIIRQGQLAAVQVMVRMRTKEEALQGKMYQELSLTQQLPNHKKLQLSVTDATRTMATFMYYALHKQLTGKARSQQACSEDFGCKTTPFRHLVTGKKQPGRPGRGKGERSKSSWTVEEVKQLESSKLPQKRLRHGKKDVKK